MSGFKIPLDFSHGDLFETNLLLNDNRFNNEIESTKESISNFIALLARSPNRSFVPDERFGFSIRNCYFETANHKDEIKGKKIGGKSDNSNTYARDLEKAICQFEYRLKNVEVKTDFDKGQSKMTINITGTIIDTKIEFKQTLILFIWRNNENIR